MGEIEKSVILGTALWGWASSPNEVFSMLDTFADAGGGVVDTAANYPINRAQRDFGKAGTLLSEWLRAHKPDNVSVLYKIGAVDNMGSSSTALTPSDIMLSAELGRGRFSDWLGAVAIHWDDREDPDAIEISLRSIAELAKDGLDVGFSGVRRPDLYLRAAPELASSWWIQVKENASTQLDRLKYQQYFPSAKYFAYGINMGGVKDKTIPVSSSLALRGLRVPSLVDDLQDFIQSPPASLNEPPADLNQLAMMLSWVNRDLTGFIIGPRNARQLADSLGYWRHLCGRTDASDVYHLTKSLRSST